MRLMGLLFRAGFFMVFLAVTTTFWWALMPRSFVSFLVAWCLTVFLAVAVMVFWGLANGSLRYRHRSTWDRRWRYGGPGLRRSSPDPSAYHHADGDDTGGSWDGGGSWGDSGGGGWSGGGGGSDGGGSSGGGGGGGGS